jgi:glycosyltransferase involved in cell wall biosynthesis
VEIAKTYEKQLHYWISEKDEGLGHALNKGFSHTSGEIMAWINSDDMYTPWSLKVVAEVFTQFPSVMWIVGFNSWWNSAGAMTSASRAPKNIYDFLLGNYAWIQQESVFWRRKLWEKAGGYINQDYKLMVDGELWTRFFLHEELYSVDCILGGYRVHSENRAKLRYRECLEEMNSAISVMKQKCSHEVLNTYAQLQLLQKVRRTPFLRYLPISYFGRRLIFPAAFKNAVYRNITYENEMWTERALAFSV